MSILSTLTFVRPTLDDKDAVLDFKNTYLSNYRKTIIAGGAELAQFDNNDFNQWLDYVNAPAGTNVFGYAKVADDVFLAYLANKVVGIINIRYELNDFLLKTGGHIGYSTHPDHQGQGIATQMTAYALDVLKQKGIDKALITCEDTNIASSKVIEKNGGVLENTFNFNGKIKRRYWIDLS